MKQSVIVIKLTLSPKSTTGPSTNQQALVISHLTQLPLLENNYGFWPFKKEKKSFNFRLQEIHSFIVQWLSYNFLKIFLDQTELMSCRSRKAKRAARVFSVSWFQQAPHSRGSCSGWKPERATEPTPGIHEPIWDLSGRWARDQWNTLSPGTQTAELEGWPEPIVEDGRPENTPRVTSLRPQAFFHCFRPREGKSEHQGRSVLFFFFLFSFFFLWNHFPLTV